MRKRSTTIVLFSLIVVCLLVSLVAYCFKQDVVELWDDRDAAIRQMVSLKSHREIGGLIELYIDEHRHGPFQFFIHDNSPGNGEEYEAAILGIGSSAFPVVFWQDLKAMRREQDDLKRRHTFFRQDDFERKYLGHLMLRMSNTWPSDVVAFLCKALRSKNADVRFLSASYLVAVRHPFVDEAIPLLQSATKDADWNVRGAASYSLKVITGAPR